MLGTDNITDARKEHSELYGLPVDCVWTIRVPEGHQAYLMFDPYELALPNDCHQNYVQVRPCHFCAYVKTNDRAQTYLLPRSSTA